MTFFINCKKLIIYILANPSRRAHLPHRVRYLRWAALLADARENHLRWGALMPADARENPSAQC